jgi:hypothetical protein
MTKWFVIIALVLLAPKFVNDTFTSGVNFVSTQGKALTSEVVKEATKTINEAK